MTTNDIAVIGMACRFPGARNPQKLWRNLAAGRVSIGEVPPGRWRWQDYADGLSEDNRNASKWGGFVDDVDAFDRAFFEMSAREVAPMDPQQRFALELAWSCFESAGLRPSRFAGKRVGVYLGIANLDYKELVEAGGTIDAHYATGVGASVLSNRLSFHFDWRGPSMSIDTACSSSLFAIHAASRALRDDECSMALAGGVSLLLTPRRFLCFTRARMLSPTGRIRSFDDSADGMVRGEGGGLILLKPLARALEDGNHILGIIKGSATNHSGRTRSLTYPSPEAQSEVIRRAQRNAGVSPAAVSYVEAHGTGTPKGDPIEIAGLIDAFGRADGHPTCGLGSVKANLGHLEAAAGIAGVIKVLLAMQHRTLPPLANFSTLNSRTSLEGTPFRIVDRVETWQENGPRIAGVSSFGFAGTNAHVVLQEGPAIEREAAPAGEHVLCLSAKTPAALARRKTEMAAWLEGDGMRFDLAGVCAAAILGREHFDVRAAVTGRTREEIVAALSREDAVAAGRVKEYVDGADPDAWIDCQRMPEAVSAMPSYSFEKTTCWVASTSEEVAGVKPKPTAIVLRPLAQQDVPAPAAEPTIDDLLERIYLGSAEIDQVLGLVE